MLGSCTPAYRGDDALRCERYLLHAVWRWLSKCAPSEDGQRTYLSSFRWWVAFSDRRALDRQLETRPYHLTQWLDAVEEVSRSPRSVNTRASVIRSWFTWLFDQEMIARTPFRPGDHLRAVDKARVITRPGQRRQSLVRAEAQSGVDWCLNPGTPAHWACGIALMMSGLRSIELERAQIEDLTAVAATEAKPAHLRMLVRGKGKRAQKTRVIVLEHWASAAVQRQLQSLSAGVGRPRSRGALIERSRESVPYWVKQVTAYIGRPEITAHDLRRTNATLLRNNGAALEQVQDHLGHANPETTKTCYDTERREMAATTGLEVTP